MTLKFAKPFKCRRTLLFTETQPLGDDMEFLMLHGLMLSPTACTVKRMFKDLRCLQKVAKSPKKGKHKWKDSLKCPANRGQKFCRPKLEACQP